MNRADSLEPRIQDRRRVHPYSLTTNHDRSIDIVTVCGELDLALSIRLTPDLNTLLSSPTRNIMFDLEAVTFMDASGIALLLNAYRRLHLAGHRLAIACPEGSRRHIFEITRLDRQLPLYPTGRAALQALRSGEAEAVEREPLPVAAAAVSLPRSARRRSARGTTETWS